MEQMAFLFTGQGAQFPGMGKDLTFFKIAEEVFDTGDEIVGRKISDLCFNGPADELKQTKNQQPAIIAVILAIIRLLEQKGIFPHIVAGNSLGEYGALTMAGVISWRDCLKTIAKRAELMEREAKNHTGIMYAITGLEINKVQKIIAKVKEKGIISIANYTTEKQIVISGEIEPVLTAVNIAQENGAIVIQLEVSGAWHSDLMRGVESEFREFLQKIDFYLPVIPVLHNLTAAEEKDPDCIREIMVGQICHQVRWYEIIQEMLGRGITIFVEIGPGRVLTRLLKKIIPKGYSYSSVNICTRKELEEFINLRKLAQY